jgi:hypothetical protein
MMDGGDSNSGILVWLAALAVVLLAFYGLDLLVMGAQGLPLNWDLTPAR